MANEETEAKEEEKKPAKIAAGTNAGTAAPDKPRSGVLPILVLGVALIGASAGVTFFVVRSTMPPAITVRDDKVSAGKIITHDLGELYVNIAATKGTRILKLVPFLVLSDAKMSAQLGEFVPLLRDRVSQSASSMTIDELEGPKGREALKREVITSVNSALKDRISGAVVDVYFSEYLIQ